MHAPGSMSVPLRPGDMFAGRYRVDATLGAGGMGVVLGAVDLQGGHRVAIKVLNAEATGSDELVSRFVREAHATARLRSKNVARVLDWGTTEQGQRYLVTERLDGKDFSALVEAARSLEPRVVVEYLLQVCEGLAEAHSAGIVHRDLKPANLFLTETTGARPLVKILDFGICKMVEDRSQPSLTKVQDLLGTPRYMSPEQLTSSRDVDGRTDIWAIGVILYELLTKRPPFDESRLTALMSAVATRTPEPIRRARPDVSEGLSAVVSRCLAKMREDRYGNVEELAAALAPHGSGRAPAILRHVPELEREPETRLRIDADEVEPETNVRAPNGRPPTARLAPHDGSSHGWPPLTPPTMQSEPDRSSADERSRAAQATPARDHPSANPRMRQLGRYVMWAPLASGGMASVHYGVVRSDAGVLSPVALKRIRAELSDPQYVAMLRDEARIAGSIRHPNVVGTVDVIAIDGETMIALEYVPGASLSQVLRATRSRQERIPIAIAAAIAVDTLRGLEAAHQAVDPLGRPLEIVHRDVSPQNILLDESGRARIADFGVASARGRLQRTTETGSLKGKLGYLAPEQVHGKVSRAVDVYACGAVLWEMLTGRVLFQGSDAEILAATLLGKIAPPSTHAPEIPPALDEAVMKALSHEPTERHASAAAMEAAIVASTRLGGAELASWLEVTIGDELEKRRAAVREMLIAVEQQSALIDVPAPARALAGAPGTTARGGAARGGAGRTGRAFVALLLGMIVVGGAALAVAARGAATRETPRTAAPVAPNPTPDVSLATANSAAPAVTEGEPSASGLATTSATAKDTVPPKSTRPAAHTRPRPSSTAKRVDCATPYVIDSEGHTIWRRECFKN
jgi:eukaryotic-like serine/threonine-protein kinase